jgi:hypothetical protein
VRATAGMVPLLAAKSLNEFVASIFRSLTQSKAYLRPCPR